MTKQYKSYDEEFKKTLVSLYENGKRLSELSREYGVNESTIRPWIKKYGTIITSTGETTTNDEILKLQKKSWIRKWNIKKSSRHILKKIEDKIKFIDENKYLYDIRILCKCLGIHHFVYYYHCNYQTNSYKIANQN